MEKKFADQRWALPNSTENAVELRGGDEEDEDEDEEEEALSLSDLPLIQKDKEKEEDIISPRENQTQEQDFDFCSFLKESEMCVADEIFFQGQILPLGRHSVSSDKGSLHYLPRSISRSGSMDHYYSGRLISSRSSSISSHQSSTSGSSSATTTTNASVGKFNHRPPRNRFHYSHPSPSPKLHSSIYKQGITTSNHRNSVNKSSIWNILKLGLVTTPPEIGFQDLKTRSLTNNNSSNCRNFGSRNSTSSNSSSVTSIKKKKARDLLGGCKCSVDAVDTVSRRAVMIKRSASEGDVELRQEIKPTKKQVAKKQLSHHRTFEWLKQLSVEGTADDEA